MGKRRRVIYSSEEDYDSSHEVRTPRHEANRGRSPTVPLSPQPELQPPASPQPGPSTAAVEKEPEDVELDDEILQLLGDAPKEDTPLGPAIHKDIANRWKEILKKGLQKEVKDKLLKEYAVPSNCDLLLAPILNPEAKAALSEVFVKRDTSLQYKQKQLGAALSALANITQLIISNETSKQKLLKPLSDACRILCDSHYMETRTRRHFVVTSVNTALKDTLIEAERDKFLFGDNVSEKLKAAKNIQRSGEALKYQQKKVFTKSNFAYRRGRLNYQQQHRKTEYKPAGDAARPPRQTTTPRQTPAARHYSGGGAGAARKPADRSPPRKTYRR